MVYRSWQTMLLLIVLGLYGFLFSLALAHPKPCDFASLYAALKLLVAKENPYVPFLAIDFSPQTMTTNLNPPFGLWLLTPLISVNYLTAFSLWSSLSFILGLIGASISFYYALPSDFLRKNWLLLFLLYLSLFSTATNLIIGQLGAILLFFIMAGYYFYLQKRHCLAGFFWGIIIALKLFPGLLIFYALLQRRYKVVMAILVTIAVAMLIPLLAYGNNLYTNYYGLTLDPIHHSGNWNASFYGFLFRLLLPLKASDPHHLVLIKSLYGISFFALLIWYLKKLRHYEVNKTNHQSFCFVLIMMLLMSPLGWLYYFSLLIFPLSMTWVSAVNEKKAPVRIALLWLLCLFLLNFPMTYLKINQQPAFINRLGFFSFYFYGLLLLAYLLLRKGVVFAKTEFKMERARAFLIAPTLVIFVFGMLSYGLIAKAFSPSRPRQHDIGLITVNKSLKN